MEESSPPGYVYGGLIPALEVVEDVVEESSSPGYVYGGFTAALNVVDDTVEDVVDTSGPSYV